jgi:hypothetical protein
MAVHLIERSVTGITTAGIPFTRIVEALDLTPRAV